MIVNALFGVVMAVAVHRLATAGGGTRALAMGAGLTVALHPALVPYTAAVMTEAVAAALVSAAAAVARAPAPALRVARSTPVAWGLAGLLLGVATLVRPQCLVLAPALGLLAPVAPAAAAVRGRAAAIVTAGRADRRAPRGRRATASPCTSAPSSASTAGGTSSSAPRRPAARGKRWTSPKLAAPSGTRRLGDSCFGLRRSRRDRTRPPGVARPRSGEARRDVRLFRRGPLVPPRGERRRLRRQREKSARRRRGRRQLRCAPLRAGDDRSRPTGRRRPRAVAMAAGAWCSPSSRCTAGSPTSRSPRPSSLSARDGSRARPSSSPGRPSSSSATGATHAVFFGAGRYGLVVVPFVTGVSASPCAWGCAESRSRRSRASRRRARRGAGPPSGLAPRPLS